jgi:glucose dehydrogenase
MSWTHTLFALSLGLMRINVALLTSMASLLIGSACAHREAPRVGDGAPPQQQRDWTALPGKDFPLVGGNYANLRHSTLTQINTSNIGQLGGAWMVRAENGRTGSWMQSTPVVVDGIMYVTTGHIQARDARSGALIWQFPKGGGGAVAP